MSNQEFNALAGMMTRQVQQLEDIISRVQRGEVDPSYLRNAAAAVAQVKDLQSSISATVDSLAADGEGLYTDPPPVEETRVAAAPPRAVRKPTVARQSSTGIKGAMIAGAQTGMAIATAKGVSKVGMAYLGPHLPPMLQGPAGEAVIALLLPAALQLACEHYGHVIPQADLLRSVAEKAIQGTSQDLVEKAIAGFVPMLAEIAALGAGNMRAAGQLTSDEQGPVIDTEVA